jgi:hypothetical protein
VLVVLVVAAAMAPLAHRAELPVAPDAGDDAADGDGAVADEGPVVLTDELRLGNCWTETSPWAGEGAVEDVRRVGCEQPHDGEVFARVHLEGPPGESYPGDTLVERRSWDACLPEFAPYVGASYSASRWEIGYVFPSDETWQTGDRLVVCFLFDPSLAQIEGSRRGTGT